MLDQDQFFTIYDVKKEFQQSGLKWWLLEKIYDDYCSIYESLQLTASKLEEELQQKIDTYYENNHFQGRVRSVRARVKDPEHLIEKIIRKRGKEQNYKYENIDENNYKFIIRDLIGVRVLTLSKEEWEYVHDAILQAFNAELSKTDFGDIMETPVAYTRYGDRDIFHGKIAVEHSTVGYRSQHYIVKYKNVYCEIQVRTLAEETFGEFDHFVKYPYRQNNNFLLRYSGSVSQLLDSVDELISTCITMGEEGWAENAKRFSEDEIMDLNKLNKPRPTAKLELNDSLMIGEFIDATKYMERVLRRKIN